MQWAAAVCLAAAAIVAVRWWGLRADALGRAQPFPWISTILLVALAGAAATPWLLRVRLEGRLSKAASTVAGTSVRMNCQSFGGAFVDAGADLGYVSFGSGGVPERSALLKREQCADLADYLRSDKRSATRDQVIAVHVLTHETIHMSGVTSEAETECLALQRDFEMARLLGASQGAARDLVTSYWREVYPWMPTQYRTVECGPGGDLDAGLPRAPWTLDR